MEEEATAEEAAAEAEEEAPAVEEVEEVEEEEEEEEAADEEALKKDDEDFDVRLLRFCPLFPAMPFLPVSCWENLERCLIKRCLGSSTAVGKSIRMLS